MSAIVIKEIDNVNKLKNITSKTASSGIINNEHTFKQALFTVSVVWIKPFILRYPLLIAMEYCFNFYPFWIPCYISYVDVWASDTIFGYVAILGTWVLFLDSVAICLESLVFLQ